MLTRRRLMAMRLLGGGGVAPPAWVDVEQPPGWTWADAPVTIQRNPLTAAYRAVSGGDVFDVAMLAPTGSTVYVDGENGSDSNGGTSWADAFATMEAGYAENPNRMYVAAGEYPTSFDLDSGITVSGNLSVIGVGGQVVTGKFLVLEWSADESNPGAYVASTVRTIAAVRDRSTQDALGLYTALTQRANAADVAANAGSWHSNGSSLWVRTADDRAPDADIRVYTSDNPARSVTNNGEIQYRENVTVEYQNGGLSALAGGARRCFYEKNCNHLFSDVGLAINGCTSILQSVTVAGARGDGISYHEGVGSETFAPLAVEIDCAAYANGSAASDQNSTMHDGGSVIRVNGEYWDAYASDITDTGAGTQTWMVACVMSNEERDVICFANSVGAESWLDECTLSDALSVLIHAAGATVHIHNCNWSYRFTEVSGGQVTSYYTYETVAAHSRFAGVDDTALASYSPDVGAAWTEAGGTWKISNNKLINTGTGAMAVLQNAAIADGVIEGWITLATSGYQACGLFVRASDVSNGWLLEIDYVNTKLSLYEVSEGVKTERDTTPETVVKGRRYHVRVTMSGQAITAVVTSPGGQQTLAYSSATYNQSVTTHGFRQVVGGSYASNVFDECGMYTNG